MSHRRAQGEASHRSSGRTRAPEPPDLARRLALRPRELAECLGVSERALRQLAPELPRVCRRGLVLYPVDAIREWLRREARADGDAIKALVADTLANLSDGS